MVKRSLFGVIHREKCNKIQCVEAEMRQIQRIHLSKKLISHFGTAHIGFQWLLCHWKFKN